jgi:uroporphyrinogen-III decarboxylase
MGEPMSEEAQGLYGEREKRVQAAIDLRVPDRVPVLSADDAFSWAYAGISMRDFMTDNEKMMMAREMFHRDFQTDMAYVPPAPMDPLTLVVGSPCLLKMPGEDIPEDSVFQLVETEIMKEEDYEYAIENGYMQLLLKLLPKLRPGVKGVEEKFLAKLEWASNLFHSNVERFKASGVPCWAGGGMESPFGILTMLRSYERFCLDLYRRPELVSRAVEKFTEEFAQMAIVSCKFLTGIPRAIIGLHRESSSFFSLDQFEQFALPQIERLVDVLSKEGIITILHCDGDWTPNLPYLTRLPKGKCVLDLDASTDIVKAKELLGDRMCIDGNVMEIMLSFGTPAEIEAHCRKLIDLVGKDGGFILKGEIPKEAKPENIQAMINTAKTYGQGKGS